MRSASTTTTTVAPDSCRRVRMVAGLLLTTAALVLQGIFVWHAGPLWRDEANSANLAALGSWKAIYAHAHYDSFPLIWDLCLWLWGSAGWTSDAALRCLGVLGGCAQLAALWFAVRTVGIAAPVVAIVLYALVPSTVVYGTMARGYGLGAAAFLLAVGALVRCLRAPSRSNCAFLAGSCVLAVQTNFANGVLVAAALGSAAIAGWFREHGRQRLWVGLAASLAAAVASLTLSLPWIRYAFAVGEAEQRPVGLPAIATVWLDSLTAGLPFAAALWAIAALALLAAVINARTRTTHDAAVLAFVALAVPACIAGFLLYFWGVARLPSQQWHYLSLNAWLAVAGEIAVHALLAPRPRTGPFALAAFSVAGVWLGALAAPLVAVRMTNVDVIATVLHQQARPTDLVVVVPWYCGVSFQRYYAGPAPWITLPDLDDHRFHYHLAIRAKAAQGDQGIAAERQRIVSTLLSGGRVWLVGDLPAPLPGQSPPRMPPAPHPETGWRAGPYLQAWEMQIAALLRDHGRDIFGITLPDVGPVNPWEHLPLTVIAGWQ